MVRSAVFVLLVMFWTPIAAETHRELDSIWRCVAAKVDDRPTDGVSLLPADLKYLGDGTVLAAGKMGYHLTWLILFDLRTRPVSAFETTDMKSARADTMFRMPVPEPVREALKQCCVTWHDFGYEEQPPRRRDRFSNAPDAIGSSPDCRLAGA